MPSLEAYRRSLDYSYAPGLFPSMEALTRRPELVRRVLLHSKAEHSDATERLLAICQSHNIRVETADRALARLSGTENVFAAAVFAKEQATLAQERNHLVLHQPSDGGNLGTMLRTALGFGYVDIAIIRPAADAFDPRVVRASMGAVFSLRLMEYEGFEAYRAKYPQHALYPFMLQGATSLQAASSSAASPHALVFGNEGSGLPEAFSKLGQAVRIPHGDRIDSLNLAIAAGIGMYAFSNPSDGSDG